VRRALRPPSPVRPAATQATRTQPSASYGIGAANEPPVGAPQPEIEPRGAARQPTSSELADGRKSVMAGYGTPLPHRAGEADAYGSTVTSSVASAVCARVGPYSQWHRRGADRDDDVMDQSAVNLAIQAHSPAPEGLVTLALGTRAWCRALCRGGGGGVTRLSGSTRWVDNAVVGSRILVG
jgi:hypothetical protein